MSLIFRPFGDPSLQRGLVLVRHDLLRVRWRHDLVLIGRKDALDDLAGVRLAGNDGDLARFAFAVGGFTQIEAQLAFARVIIHAVAGEALLREHRPHVAIEIDGVGGGNEQQEKGGGRLHHLH
jgi:hypothetical protein